MLKKFFFIISQNLAHSKGSVCLFVSIKHDAHLITPNFVVALLFDSL